MLLFTAYSTLAKMTHSQRDTLFKRFVCEAFDVGVGDMTSFRLSTVEKDHNFPQSKRSQQQRDYCLRLMMEQDAPKPIEQEPPKKAEHGFMEWQESEQVGGNHYGMAIQPITFIEANKIPFSEGSVIKYVCRHSTIPKEEAIKSLKKAVNYIQRILKARYGVK